MRPDPSQSIRLTLQRHPRISARRDGFRVGRMAQGEVFVARNCSTTTPPARGVGVRPIDIAVTRDNPSQPVPPPGGLLAPLLAVIDSLEAKSRSARTWFSGEAYRTATPSFLQMFR
jgi:hypothetical protein